MQFSADVSTLVLYIAQQLGVMLGFGSQAILLLTYLLGKRDGIINQTEDAIAHGVYKVLVASIALIVVSGVIMTAMFVQSQDAVLYAPAFYTKWALILLAIFCAAGLKGSNTWNSAWEGLSAANWGALFIVHIFAPVTTYAILLKLYVVWTAGFFVAWYLLIFALRGHNALLAVEQMMRARAAAGKGQPERYAPSRPRRQEPVYEQAPTAVRAPQPPVASVTQPMPEPAPAPAPAAVYIAPPAPPAATLAPAAPVAAPEPPRPEPHPMELVPPPVRPAPVASAPISIPTPTPVRTTTVPSTPSSAPAVDVVVLTAPVASSNQASPPAPRPAAEEEVVFNPPEPAPMVTAPKVQKPIPHISLVAPESSTPMQQPAVKPVPATPVYKDLQPISPPSAAPVAPLDTRVAQSTPERPVQPVVSINSLAYAIEKMPRTPESLIQPIQPPQEIPHVELFPAAAMPSVQKTEEQTAPQKETSAPVVAKQREESQPDSISDAAPQKNIVGIHVMPRSLEELRQLEQRRSPVMP